MMEGVLRKLEETDLRASGHNKALLGGGSGKKEGMQGGGGGSEGVQGGGDGSQGVQGGGGGSEGVQGGGDGSQGVQGWEDAKLRKMEAEERVQEKAFRLTNKAQGRRGDFVWFLDFNAREGF
jgi:hypothetical protein